MKDVRMTIWVMVAMLIAFVSLSTSAAKAGLVAHWRLDGNADDSAGNNNGTVYGATLTTDRFGNPDSAYSFDCDGDYIGIADNDTLDLTGGATLAAWVNTNSLTTYQGIVGRWNYAGSPDKESILLEVRGDIDDKLWFWISNDGTDSTLACVKSNLQLLTNTWYHVVATYDGNTMRLYVNGQEHNSLPKSGNIFVSDSEWNIGTYNYGGIPSDDGTSSFFDGIIDDVQVYNFAATDNDVAWLYNNPGSTIPEPATLLLLGLGAVMLRRKR